MRKDIFIADPYLLQFNLLTDCTLDCDYCYLSSLRGRESFIVRANDFKKFLDKFKKYCSKYGIQITVDITGGDIWLHPEIKEILIYAYSSSHVRKIGLMANSLWHKNAKKLITLVRNKLGMVQLNIDVLNSRLDDLEFLESAGIRSGIKLMLSKDKPYLDSQIKVLNKLMMRFGKLLVSFDRLCPISEGQTGGVLETKAMLKIIDNVTKKYPNRVVTNDPLIKAYLLRNELGKFGSDEDARGCVIPSSGLTVFPDGSIKLCARIPEFTTGFNINNFDLEPYIEQYTPLMESRKKDCLGCKYFPVCQGGCPASSYIINNGSIGKDINCIKNLKSISSHENK